MLVSSERNSRSYRQFQQILLMLSPFTNHFGHFG
ncbi:hypothetical protein SOVF_005880 [Spinacia oleracea]|nr:hypothetical protein SOVF_005880 [Spinacia oleracea]